MAQLIVRDLEDDIVGALKARARANGRSAEAEHREILRRALVGAASFWDWIRAIPPDDADDQDFERSADPGRDTEL
jgi:antitoxin FitA